MNIQTKTYDLPSISSLNKEILLCYVKLFWTEIFQTLHSDTGNKHLLLMCKVGFSENSEGLKSIGDMRKVNFNDLNLFVEYLCARLGLLSDSYKVNPVSKIVFTYIVRDGLADGSRSLLQNQTYEVKAHTYNNLKLPLTMDPQKYGTVIATQVLNEDVTRYIVVNDANYTFQIDVSALVNNVQIIGAANLSWVDTKLNETAFKREIAKNILFIKDGAVEVKCKQLNAKPFRNISVDKELTNTKNFMCIDIESVNIDGKHFPYLICGYSENKYIYSYADDTSIDSQKLMFYSFIDQLLEFKHVKYVYAHNFSNYDGILLLKHLINYEGAKVKPNLFNGKLISVIFKLNKRTIKFKDSNLLLPMSLRSLCKAFSVTTQKTFFPFNLIDINYVGEFPACEEWGGITISEYEELRDKHTGDWSFKDEAIKYCKIDCKSLSEVLVKFNELVFTNFKMNIHDSLTLPALSMRIYKSQFMPKDALYQILGTVEADIREAYTGGSVDVYLPHNGKNNDFFNPARAKLRCYDINSLYPYMMSSMEMPVGKPIAFEGDITKFDAEAFGYFYCKITTPPYIEHPILQRKIKTADGIRTIAGLGSWEGWIFSLELLNALKYGYKFDIIRGYTFRREIIFKDYIEKLYNMRLEYHKDNPLNMICKLLMNSLYGKFGMKTTKSVVTLYDNSNDFDRDLLSFDMETYGESISDFVKLDNHILIVRKAVDSFSYNENNNWYEGLDVNVGIAAAVTAGGRICMSLVKNRTDFNLYYSDTDSIFIDGSLPGELVGNAIGQFKLEYEVRRGVFIAPKVYSVVTTEGKTITKIKGVNKHIADNINIKQMESLLQENSKLEFTQDKWFKKVLEGDINVTEVAYQLKVTSNKREAVYLNYPEYGTTAPVFSYTKPYEYSKIEVKP